jgi:ATP-dependent protease ClpP protease subunit
MKSSLSLLMVLDRYIPGVEKSLSGNTYDKNTLYLNTGKELVSLSVTEISRCYYAFDRKLPDTFRQGVHRIEAIKPLLEKRVGKKTAAAFLDRSVKVDLDILINSPGGGFFRQLLDNVIRFAKNRKGKVNSFTFYEAGSAAQMLFAETEKRYCLKFSHFICHRGQPSDDDYKKDEYYDNFTERQYEFDQHKEILDKFFERHKPTYDDYIKKLIYEAQIKPKHSLYVSGYVAEMLGMVDKAFHSFDDLEDCIQKHIGQPAMADKRVSRMVSKARREYNELVSKNGVYHTRFPFFHKASEEEKLLNAVFGKQKDSKNQE